MLNPVAFPPGCASEAAIPDPTMSSATPTIGTVCVTSRAARIAPSPPQKMTSTLELTISANMSLYRSG
jgi:hypothetical protein